jgi:hypothetical protein
MSHGRLDGTLGNKYELLRSVWAESEIHVVIAVLENKREL